MRAEDFIAAIQANPPTPGEPIPFPFATFGNALPTALFETIFDLCERVIALEDEKKYGSKGL